MDPTARLRSWTPRLLFLSVTAILVLVGVIQYQWFSRSAAVEIDAAVRGLEGGLRQSVFREFQRYAPLTAELEAARKATSEGRVKVLLDRLWTTYGPEGVSPDLLSLVGVALPDNLAELRTAENPDWERQVWPGEPGKGGSVIVKVGEGPEEPSLLIGLNMDGFFNTYVFPSLLEQFPGAELHWDQAPGPPPGDENFDSRAYTFNPIMTLLGKSSVSRTLRIGIPRIGDLPFRTARFKMASEGPSVRAISNWTLRATLPPDAPVLAIEQRLAWNWLGSVLLLVVLAAAFGLVLRQSGRLAAQRLREREFVASVSHELRTPLTVIRSAADNFTQGIVPAERQGRYGQLILDQSLRLGRMIEEMLAFAQAEAGSPEARVQAPLVFEPWLAELRPPLEALAAARKIHLSWDVAGVPASGLTDPEALRLILENLVVNAVNHAYPAPAPDQPPRPVRITLRHLVPDRLELTVEDDGRGIVPKEAKKVFEPFYRDQVSRDNQEKGSGLGLFLTRHQVRRLGGELKLETPWRRLDGTKKPGCRFSVVVPFSAQSSGEADHGR